MQKTYTYKDIKAVAQWILEQGKDYSLWLLQGDMGAGKTTLTSAIVELLCSRYEASSPTYSLINEYPVNNQAYSFTRILHADLYRLQSLEEALDAGVEDIFYQPDTLVIVEWPDVIMPIITSKYLSLHLRIENESNRTITLSFHN